MLYNHFDYIRVVGIVGVFFDAKNINFGFRHLTQMLFYA